MSNILYIGHPLSVADIEALHLDLDATEHILMCSTFAARHGLILVVRRLGRSIVCEFSNKAKIVVPAHIPPSDAWGYDHTVPSFPGLYHSH